MRALYEKDISLILIRKSSLFIFLMIGVVFTWQFSGSFSGAYLTMLGTMLALSTLSYDDSDNCMEFILTLPCTRKQYVLEKYFFVYGFSLVAGLIGLVIIILSNLIKGIPVDATLVIETVCSELPILVITGGLMIPLQLKYGPEKTRLVFIALIGLLFIVAYMVFKIPGAKTAFENAMNTLNTTNPIIIVLLLVGILCILSIASVFISTKIIENKEY